MHKFINVALSARKEETLLLRGITGSDRTKYCWIAHKNPIRVLLMFAPRV